VRKEETMYGFGNGCWPGWGSFGGGSIMFILVVAGAIIAVSFIAKNAKRNWTANDAENIIKKRFARGEISVDEYRSSLKSIRE